MVSPTVTASSRGGMVDKIPEMSSFTTYCCMSGPSHLKVPESQFPELYNSARKRLGLLGWVLRNKHDSAFRLLSPMPGIS